jgi:hypothetical protein
MKVQVIESIEVRIKRRLSILTNIFVGCEITKEDIYGENDYVIGEIVHIKRTLGHAKKTIAYLTYEYEDGGADDEFHIEFPKAEPLVVLAVQQFYEQSVQRLAPNMAEVVVIAHYRIEPNESDNVITQLNSAPSGRVDALLDYMETFDEENERERAIR